MILNCLPFGVFLKCILEIRGQGGIYGRMVLITGKQIVFIYARVRELMMDCKFVSHGTGHGVGHFLNVHEGPHGVGVRIGKLI